LRLPNAEQAIIAAAKLRDYLLSPEESGGKAAFFARLGYTRANWDRFAADLRQFHLTADAEEVTPTQYGRKFVIRAPMDTPAGVTAMVFVSLDD
jgi:hypothetical protein